MNKYLEKIASRYSRTMTDEMKRVYRFSQKVGKSVDYNDPLKVSTDLKKGLHAQKLQLIKAQRKPKLPKDIENS